MQDNLKLKEETVRYQMTIESLKSQHEDFQKTIERFRIKNQVQIINERKLKYALRSAIGDLTQATEKAVQIEVEHIRIVKEMEHRFSNMLHNNMDRHLQWYKKFKDIVYNLVVWAMSMKRDLIQGIEILSNYKKGLRGHLGRMKYILDL